MYSSRPLKCIDFFPPSLLRNSPLSKALEARNIGWPHPEKFIIICSAVLSQDPLGLPEKCSLPLLFWSKPQERPMTAREFTSIIRNCLWIVFTLFFVSFFSHVMSLNIVMKMILSLKCSGSHCRSLIRLWIFSRRPNVVIPGKIFHSNCVGMPSIRFISLKWLFS